MFIKHYTYLRNVIHGSMIETFWTVIPAIILALIAFPSFSLLYSIEEIQTRDMTIKCIGYQWYWSFEHNAVTLGWPKYSSESYMIDTRDLNIGELRLYETDRPLFIPQNANIRLVITADDVLHSFSVPAFGIKVDAVPGRLNQIGLLVERSGVYFGQCSELCGVNHGFMPIKIIVIKYESLLHEINTKY